MATEDAPVETESQTLSASVKGRVPQAYADALDALVAKRRLKFPRYSKSDALREALADHFKRHPVPAEATR